MQDDMAPLQHGTERQRGNLVIATVRHSQNTRRLKMPNSVELPGTA